jgi:CBS domain-containing protein
MTRNGDELVRLYNEIDAWLKKRSGAAGNDGLVARLDRVRDQALIRPHVEFLKDVAGLRNAIVHDRHYPPEIVADPRDELIARLRAVCDALLKPPLLRSFGSKPVSLPGHSPLRDALALMREKDFSQIIVKLAEKSALLSSEGILRWLEICVEKQSGLVAIDESMLDQIVEYEPEGSCAWLAASRPVAEAVARFAQARPSGAARLACIVVTEHGNPTEQPLRLITPWDLPGLNG